MHAPDQTKRTASTYPLRVRPLRPCAADHLTPFREPPFHAFSWSAGPYRQSWNQYGYVWNNPLNAVDPSGMDGCQLDNQHWTGGYTDLAECQGNTGSFDFVTSLADRSPLDFAKSSSTTAYIPQIFYAPVGFNPWNFVLRMWSQSSSRSSSGATTAQQQPSNNGTARGLATCAASNASSFASLLGLPKDNFWARAFLGNDFSTAANFLLGNDRGTNGRGALLSNPTPINATSIALSAIGKKVVATGGLVVKETPGGAPYAVTKFLPIAGTVGGKLLFKGLAAFSAVKLVDDGAAFGYAELQCGGIVQ